MTQSTMDTEIISGTIEAVDLEQMLNPFEVDDGSIKERKSHYVSPGDNVEFQDKHGRAHNSTELINNARLYGAELVALCGYRWVPKLNPKVYPVCPRCAEIAGDRLTGKG